MRGICRISNGGGDAVDEQSFLFSFSKKRKNIIMAEQGVIPVYQNVEAHLRAPKIKGVVSHGAGVQYDYKWAFVEE
ncbi:hypothetical protein [Enterococcus sp.]|uniref:hypothetical protein n=1 Tax=Enterococcus sp. TaxID=35783 RepID=UPI0025B7B4CE|nr:hypothetical protein [Enterococcus sp.]